jgi:menaquinone-9 beta-reductase
MSNTSYDVIVVGSGPAGATAALVAARSGLHTLLLDREIFPREKACGDAIPIQCVRLLAELSVPAFSPDDFFIVDKFFVQGPRGSKLTVPLSIEGQWSAGIVSRYVFDETIRQAAINAGAEFCQVSVSAPILENGQVVGVRGKEGKTTVEFCAKVVIAADGATSAVARVLLPEPRTDSQTAIALRGYVQSTVPLDGTIDLVFLQEVQPGYAWFFPTSATTANIGVGMRVSDYNAQDKTLQDMLQIYLKSSEIRQRVGDNPTVTSQKSWQLPLNLFEQKRVYNGAILAGDAGGFVDPVTGAGIYQAVVTGKAAAETAAEAIRAGDISAAGLAKYDTRWKAILGGEIRRSNFVYRLATYAPSLIDGMLSVAKHVPSIMSAVIGKV